MTNNSTPKVTIVLPVYNGEKCLEESVASVLEQTYRNIELIIVNDCSTDATETIIDRFVEKDKRVRKISNSHNLKLPTSLNVGFENASGEYWTWTSDDNKYKKNAIECMVNYLESNKATDMVYSDYTVIDSENKELYNKALGEPKELVYGNCIGACFLYRREIAQKIGSYDTNLFLAEDYDYWIRMFKDGNIDHLDENLYYYRKHQGSLTETKAARVKVQVYRTYEKNFLFLFSLLSTGKEKVAFLDKMAFFATYGDEKVQEIENRLCGICCRYACHVKYIQFRHALAGTFLGRIYKNVKAGLKSKTKIG